MGNIRSNDKKKILLLEDELIQQKIMDHLLKKEFDLQVVMNGCEALQWLESNALPDLIIMDWIMPVMDGKSFLKRFKSHLQFLAVPIIILSSYEHVYQEVIDIPFAPHDYLEKPVNPAVLKSSIDTLLNRV